MSFDRGLVRWVEFELELELSRLARVCASISHRRTLLAQYWFSQFAMGPTTPV